MREKRKEGTQQKDGPGRPRNDLPRKGNRHLTPLSRLALRIKECREACGFSVFDAADKAGISVSQWYAIEGAQVANPQVQTLWAIESAIDVKRDSLVQVIYPKA